MLMSKEERNRILSLLETGQVNARQAAQLLDTLESETEHTSGPTRERMLRIKATHTQAKQQKALLTASIPVRLLKFSLRLGVTWLPQLSHSALEDLLNSIENGATGRLLDLNDLEQGERLEIFVE